MSVLARARPGDVVCKPFPHLVLKDALDAELCARLLREFPPLPQLAGGRVPGSNRRVTYPMDAVRADPTISNAWRGVLEEHVSQTFLDEVMNLIGQHLRRLHPGFEARFGTLYGLRGGVRGFDDFTTRDVLLDAQICANTPVLGHASSVREAHVDVPDKLFAGLLYLRREDDDSGGGDLQLCRLRDGARPRFFGHQSISDRSVEVVRTVRYQHNSLVFFLNSVRSIHGVTPRAPTRHPRLFLNLLGTVREPLFDLRRHRERLGDRIRRHLRRVTGR